MEEKTLTTVPEQATEESSVQLYNKDEAESLLSGLTLAANEKDNSNINEANDKNDVPINVAKDVTELTISDRMACSLCDVTFQERREQRDHFKSDWHRFNIKQKLKGCTPITTEKFEEIIAGDMSSISGSDSESESSDDEATFSRPKMSALPNHVRHIEKQLSSDSESEMSYHIEGIGRRHPRVFFRNKNGELLSVYRCVIHSKKNTPASVEELCQLAASLPSTTCWVVVMVAGGHFAAAVFKGCEVVAHKTFHRYVVRAKRGTVQSARDSQGGAPKSAGASIRREQERHLTEDIKTLLESWSGHVKDCDRIFLRATGSSRNIFFSGKAAPLSKADSRIRLIPFPTRRPTHKEVLRVHSMLSAVRKHGTDSTITDFIPAVPSPAKKAPKSRPEPRRSFSESPNHSPRQRLLEKAKLDLRPPTPSTSGDEAGDDLGYQDETVDFSTLNEFEATRKPRHRRKQRKKDDSSGMKHQKSPANDLIDDELYHVRNALYTACKSGNMESLKNILETAVPIKSFASPDVEHLHPSFGATQPKSGILCEARLLNTPCDVKDINAEELPCSNKMDITPTTETATENVTSDAQQVPSEVLNLPFGDNDTTLLHVAARTNNKDMVLLLLEAGADPANRDKSGQTPYLVASNKDARNVFRKFMGRFPDRYNYTQAQIPGPLTDEMEQEKKAKEAEKKKAQKKARKERLKEQKAQENLVKAEQEEKAKFLALSDREKRAIAAEKRLQAQYSQQGHTAPVLSRCFACGADMTGKVPFEYSDYKFCTTKCLRAHRDKTKTNSAAS